jgi:hypothetical protein
MHSFRQQLIKIQRAVYRKNLRKIKMSLAADGAVNRYSREYHHFLRHYRSIITASDLIKYVLTCDIVYHGDYHTLRQSQRSVLRVLREIADKRPIILCLEMFHRDDQHLLDSFMKNGLTLEEFLTKIEYRKKWEFPFDTWKPVIDLCKQYGIRVYGINSPPDDRHNEFSTRDTNAAKIIGTLAIRNPGTLLYVVDGDFHIAPSHLPARVEEKLKAFDITLKRAIICQNDANLYWQLADRHKEDSDVLQIDDDTFCIINTTPANKLQSYLNWLESTGDAFHPQHAEWEDLSDDFGNTTIPGLVKTICAILALPYPEDAVSRLEIYYGNHLDFIGIISRSKNLSRLLPGIRRKIRMDEGFLIQYDKDGTESYLIYLPNSNLNMAAEEAAHFVHAVFSGRHHGFTASFDGFYRTAIAEAIGFFGSKLINERRKVQTRTGLKKFLGSFARHKATPTREEQRKIRLSHLILQHLYLESLSRNPADFLEKFKGIYTNKKDISVELATQLGYMLGNKLFYAVKKRKLSMQEVLDLVKKKFEEPGKAFETYLSLSTRRQVDK